MIPAASTASRPEIQCSPTTRLPAARSVAMTAASRFTEVLARLVGEPDRDDLLPDQVAAACVAALPVDGASLSYTLLPDRRLPWGPATCRRRPPSGCSTPRARVRA
ncbi:hypothetical protein ACFQX8_19520 [Klenkia terrae]|uniref:hypothetical protein n=1 Tax=Klenkia terrae TaxID=1052259 RepID=UPI003621C1D7